MKYVEAANSQLGLPTIELTRRNLTILLEKLDDPKSHRTIYKEGPEYPGGGFAVKAVEDDEHYAAEDREPGTMYMPTAGESK